MRSATYCRSSLGPVAATTSNINLSCKDGRVIDVLLSGVLEKGASGQNAASIAVITDVTALKQTERQLAESEARYRSLVEDQSELVSLANPDGELRYVTLPTRRSTEISWRVRRP